MMPNPRTLCGKRLTTAGWHAGKRTVKRKQLTQLKDLWRNWKVGPIFLTSEGTHHRDATQNATTAYTGGPIARENLRRAHETASADLLCGSATSPSKNRRPQENGGLRHPL